MDLPKFHLDTIVALYVISSVLSILGSLLIVYHVVAAASCGRNNTMTTYHRLMIGLSLADIISSLRFLIFPLIYAPQLKPSAPCTVNGVLSDFGGIAATLYNSCLSIYFLLVIKYSVTDERMVNFYEWMFHAFSLSYALVCVVINLSLRFYNPNPFGIGCWISDFPSGCTVGKDMTCIRGSGSFVMQYVAGLIPFASTFITLIITHVSIFCAVRNVERRMNRHVLRVSVSNLPSGIPIDEERFERSRQTAIQSMLYVVSFAATQAFNVIVFLLPLVDRAGLKEGKYFPLQAIRSFFIPLQGLFNFLVFIRPVYRRFRSQNNTSRGVAFLKAAFTLSRNNNSPRRSRGGGGAAVAQRRRSSVAVTVASSDRDILVAQAAAHERQHCSSSAVISVAGVNEDHHDEQNESLILAKIYIDPRREGRMG